MCVLDLVLLNVHQQQQQQIITTENFTNSVQVNNSLILSKTKKRKILLCNFWLTVLHSQQQSKQEEIVKRSIVNMILDVFERKLYVTLLVLNLTMTRICFLSVQVFTCVISNVLFSFYTHVFKVIFFTELDVIR